MNRFSLLPSVNWNISHMLVINEAGTRCAYGSRGDIVIIDNIHQDDFNEIDSKFILRAHKNQRVMALTFVKHEVAGCMIESLVSCGDDGCIKVWDPETRSNTHKFMMKKINPNAKFVDVDCFPNNSCVVSVAEQKLAVKWDLQKNKVTTFNLDVKVILTCVAACPHESDLVAIGARLGLVLVYSLKGDGKLRHKIRCHYEDVFSVSWCPVAYNAFALAQLREDPSFIEHEWKEVDRTLLLASCSKDNSIYVCKAGTNGYSEAVLTLPNKPIIANSSNNRFNSHYSNFERGRYLKWIQPYVFVTYTDFNEMVYARVIPMTEQKSCNRKLISKVRMDVKALHNVHQRTISNFAIQIFDGDDLNFRVWSCSADRMIVRSGYKINHKENPFVLPLLSGHIFSLDISSTTFDRLAIGTGDGKICLWDMSSSDTVDISTLSKKIDNKVMSLKWHPYEEGILAFGTYEGRVGIFDVSMGSKTSCRLFKVYHHKPIYKLCWGPAMITNSENNNNNVKGNRRDELFLFAVGNGEILQFNPNDVNALPTNLNLEILAQIDEKCGCKFKSDMCFEGDRGVFAVGLSNGDVCIFSSKTYKLWHVIKEQPKSIMALAWHPRRVLDLSEEDSSCANWLATAGDNVYVYDVNPECKVAAKKVASLELHTSRVLDIAWNPHINGRLLSCSADSTVIIWDVIGQTVIGRYVKHCAQVLCGVWSLTNKDMVITGSSDFTCRMWSVSRDTIATVKDLKKLIDKPLEPTIVNAQSSYSETAEHPTNTSLSKPNKVETFLPSLGHDIHTCPLLDHVVQQIINKRQGHVTESPILRTSLTNGHDSSLSIDQSISEDSNLSNSPGNSLLNGDKSKNQKHFCKTPDLECNYNQVFGSEKELMLLVNHEERVLDSSGSNNLYVLVQARHDLKTKITEAIEKNQVTEHMLALASSVSPKLWKDACQVYVEQLIQAEQIMQAVNFLLALNKDEEAVDLLCDKNRFKEAFTIARLRFEDETVPRKVLEKWISFAFNSGVYRLAAHCYLYQNEEEKAGILLSKSKAFNDTVLAAKLLEPYQPDRAVELAVDSFKRHLPQISLESVQDLLTSFPEVEYMQVWYLSLKYLTKEQPNTASITKWLIGLLKDDDNAVLKSIRNVDLEKLQRVVVDNTFNMNFEELVVYVSAQIALYLSGISETRFKETALRHFIKALFHCYNYRTINSKRTQSDSAYPMMKLLQLIFPKGIMAPLEEASDSRCTLSMKSINAYFCDFAVTWLIGCDELPKSLKVLEEDVKSHNEELTSIFAIIKDAGRKLQKIEELLTKFLGDILDVEVVRYLQYIVRVKQFDNGSSAEQAGDPILPACEKSCEMANNDIKILRKKIAKFEKERVAAPNPYVFYCKVRDYLDKNNATNTEIVSKLQDLLNNAAKECGFMKD